jgi:SAM-dependent methyltransferase
LKKRSSNPQSQIPNPDQVREGWLGWDQYAPFYDWENARTLGRRDVPFWINLARQADGRVLELGCGTGRITDPLVKAGVDVVGVDRSAAMLARARHPASSVRADIRALPFSPHSFAMVLAPYGILQSLTRRGDMQSTVGFGGPSASRRRHLWHRPGTRRSEVARVRQPCSAARPFRRVASDADRISSPGPPPPTDHFRAVLRRAAAAAGRAVISSS